MLPELEAMLADIDMVLGFGRAWVNTYNKNLADKGMIDKVLADNKLIGLAYRMFEMAMLGKVND